MAKYPKPCGFCRCADIWPRTPPLPDRNGLSRPPAAQGKSLRTRELRFPRQSRVTSPNRHRAGYGGHSSNAECFIFKWLSIIHMENPRASGDFPKQAGALPYLPSISQFLNSYCIYLHRYFALLNQFNVFCNRLLPLSTHIYTILTIPHENPRP